VFKSTYTPRMCCCRYAWLDCDFCTFVQINLYNMETGGFEASYPEGFWAFVAKVGPSSGWAGGGG
jgi:hypothetical protein